jgi:hypothetical protein
MKMDKRGDSKESVEVEWRWQAAARHGKQRLPGSKKI